MPGSPEIMLRSLLVALLISFGGLLASTSLFETPSLADEMLADDQPGRRARSSRPRTPPAPRLPPLPNPDDPRIRQLQEGAGRAFGDIFAKPGDAKPIDSATADPLQPLKALFRRPPREAKAQASAAQIELGRRLFHEKKLSSDHKMSCATCHDPAKGFADGRPRARGNRGQSLKRRTIALWNVGDGQSFYWDARAKSLEAQAKDAIEREGEMDATLEAGVVWLARDPAYLAAFAAVFKTEPALSTDNIVAALVAYERTIVSPPTRFDRWIEGDAQALTPIEQDGFRLFTGKARCLGCHGGWRFTDGLVHDIGLASPDRGSAAIAAGVGAADRSFKTPSLREAAWSGSFMHDGSLKSLDAVVRHYEAGKLRRPSLASELREPIRLTPQERGQLVAFLKSISSDQRPARP